MRRHCYSKHLAVAFSLIAAPLAQIAPAGAQTTNVVARSGDTVLTEQDIQDTLAIDGSALDTPLSADEVAQARQNITDEFNRNPTAFAKSRPIMEKMVEVVRHGSELDRTQLGLALWCRWSNAGTSDPLVARWVTIMKRHNPEVVSANGLTVTQRDIDAVIASNDWVAKTAGQPMSTAQSRATFTDEVRRSFSSMLRQKQEALAEGVARWYALQDPIMDHSDLHAKAVSLVHQNVHSASDVPTEARSLEFAGLQFHAAMNQFAENMAKISGIGTVGSTQAEGINFATRRFMGMGH